MNQHQRFLIYRNNNIVSRIIMLILIASALGVVSQSMAQTEDPYPGTPDWRSADTEYATGGAFVDLDHDGWLDFVVANGNDIRRGTLSVYYNLGDGTFNTWPDWQSDDVEYNGHLDIADVNGDGWLDVGVAVLLPQGVSTAKVYFNNGGVLSSLPDWRSSEFDRAFGCAFGDVNGDGRPDLAIATGWAYSGGWDAHNYVYINENGTYPASASWQTSDLNDNQGVLWTDADHDGWLDLVLIGVFTHTSIYRNLGGVLETTASWHTTDNANQDSIMGAVGDVTNDGYRDLFVTDNNQLGGSGKFRQYDGLPEGFYTTTPSWSYFDGYGSALALADVNLDGMLDLATGAWWDYTRLFYNNGAGLDVSPSWSSSGTSVVEKIVFGDLDPACGVEKSFTSYFTLEAGAPRVFHLPQQPIQTVLDVRIDGQPIGPADFTFNRESAWISVDMSISGSLLEVDFTTSAAIDMGVTNWDDGLGNYIYYNQLIEDCNENGTADGCDIANGTSPDDNANGIPDECESALALEISGVCPGTMTITATGATPNGWVAFVYGTRAGNFTIPNSNPCAGTVLGVRYPFLPGAPMTARADGSGMASITGNVPANLCDRVFIQAIDVSTCGVSGVGGF